MKKLTVCFCASLALLMVAMPGLAATYVLDSAHSSVTFKVKHLAISYVKGEFRDFTGTFDYDPDKPETWQVKATIQAATIDTDNEDRDNHLRSQDFLDVENFHTIEFESTGVEMVGENKATLQGNLTMHGVTKPVELELNFLGMAEFMGTTKAGFEATGKINRKDFGLTWHKALETGSLVVGDEVQISLEVEGNQQ